MDVQHHEDPRAFKALAEPFYAADTLRHTVALVVMARLLDVALPQPARMATLHEGDDLVGVALRTPPWPLIASGLPTDASVLDFLVPRWLEHDPELPGVNGPRENAEAFADAWRRYTGGSVREGMSSRLFRLGELTSPTASGAGRQATEDDVDLVVKWRHEFQLEALGEVRVAGDDAVVVRRMIEMGDSLVIWEDRGEPVSLACASAPIGGMSRVAPVYTPPEYRGRGYGSAVTAAVSRQAQLAGAHDVILFTDLANPVSNSIYQKIGYRPVYDSTELMFTQLPSTT